MTVEELEWLIENLTAAQSMLLAGILRPLIDGGAVAESALSDSLAEKERAALDRRTPETPALLGLIDLLRRDLGLPERNHPPAS
jgi:hypothetical protein